MDSTGVRDSDKRGERLVVRGPRRLASALIKGLFVAHSRTPTTKTDPQPVPPRGPTDWHKLLPWASAAAVAAGVYVSGLSYSYLLGFYEQFQATPQQAGVSFASPARFVWGFAILGLAGIVPAVAFARYMLRNLPPRAAIGALVVLLVLSITIIVVADPPPSSMVAVPVLLAIIVVVCVLVWGISFKPVRPTPAWVPWAGRVVGTLIGVGAVMALALSPWGFYIAGAHDGVALIKRAPDESYVSVWQGILGEAVYSAEAVWLPDERSPLAGGSASVIVLGEAEGLMLLFDVEQCVPLRVPVGNVTLTLDRGLQPRDEPAEPDHQSEERAQCVDRPES